MLCLDREGALDLEDCLELVQRLDPDLAGALLDPESYRPCGQLRITALARATGRPVPKVRGDLDYLRDVLTSPDLAWLREVLNS